VVVVLGTNSQFLPLTPAGKPPRQGQIVVPHARLRPPTAQASPAPGVYRTAPYSCIVMVPGPHPDDQAIVNPRGGHDTMPVITPDLQFIPLRQAKK
jgi:hypothetical protein